MRDRYLEVTFRKGRALAAYLYLSREPGTKSTRTEKVGSGLLADVGSDGELISLEFTAPQKADVSAVNAVLERFGLAAVTSEEVRPLQAA